MPKKKKGKKKKGKQSHVGPDTAAFMENYLFACRILGTPTQPEFEEEVGTMITEGSQLSQIVFGERELNPLGMRCIVEGLLGTMVPIGAEAAERKMNGETYLNVSEIQVWKSNVGDDGAGAIAKLMKTVKDKSFRLTIVDLMHNNIGPRGCAYLGAALAGPDGNTTLKKLSLDHNPKIGDLGAKALCSGLMTNQTLEMLGLEFCGLGPDGARSIAQTVFVQTCKLNTLRLMGNKIGNSGLVSLVMGLKRNTTVQTLDIGDNGIGEHPSTDEDKLALENMVDCLAENTTLTAINLDLNFIGSNGYELLSEEHKERLRPPLTKALVFAAGIAPDAVPESTELPKKGKRKGGGKKKKKKR